MNNHNIEDSFQKLMSEMYIIYEGLRFEKTSAGFLHNGVLCRDIHEMDILVQHEKESLAKSIKESDILNL